jgi:metallophosphoesterase superfamily enzyme
MPTHVFSSTSTEEAPSLHFVAGEPAILFENSLLIADLHLGIEAETESKVIAERAISASIQRITDLVEKTRAKRLIVIGDAGHMLPAHKASSEFGVAIQLKVNQALRQLEKKFDVIFLSGNHDGGIAVKTEKELIIEDVGMFHGHRWPSKELMQCKIIIAAHSHQVIIFEDNLGHRSRQKVWVKGHPTAKLLERYEYKNKQLKAPEFIIMPAFTDFSLGWDIKKGLHGPAFSKEMFKIESAYLLDGTEITIE